MERIPVLIKTHRPASLGSRLNKDEDNVGRRKRKHLMVSEARYLRVAGFQGARSLACGREPGAFPRGRVQCAEPSAAPLPAALGRGKAYPARGRRLDLGTEPCTIRSSRKLATEHPKHCAAMGFTGEWRDMLTKRGPAERARAARGGGSAIAPYIFPQGLASPAPAAQTRAWDVMPVGFAGNG